MVEQISSDLRSFKHDYINIIKIIGNYLDLKSYNELNEFFKRELMPESIKILRKDRCFLLLKHIKIDPLKGIMSSKIIIAQSKKIITKLNIIDDIDNLSISILDICRIIGVILDNAIEAAELCDNRFIEIAIFKNDKITTFIINNSCPTNTPPIYKIYEKNFSTKGLGRGVGLKSVRNIINEKYKNVTLNTQIENSVFQQELVIF
ncbi:MAG: GHKL domain-containing protein [Bacillota bacterium]|nr:GHKL domain-containing protein [Bacillota bacterium]